jgi:triacylglycerol lipase
MNAKTEFYQHALISRLAYKDLTPDVLKEWEGLGFTYVKFFSIEGAQAYVLGNEERITIAFRGTEPKEKSDIIADLKANHNKGFHRGFYQEYKKIRVAIDIELLTQISEKIRPIYVTGHSLGAAIASIFCFHHSEVAALYTYGCPRNASWSKSKELKVPHYRCVNNNDIVPKVPPSIMGFSHHGELHYINYYGNIRELTTWQRTKDSWRGRKRAWQKGQKFDGIYDHMMDEYCSCLEDKE